MSILEANENHNEFKSFFNQFSQSLAKQQNDDFANLKNDEERINFLNRIFPKFNSIFSNERNKDMDEALLLKEKGNAEFVRGDTYKAALSYSQAIVMIPSEESSRELALLIANRSAALYHLKKYDEAISDINYALRQDYPTELRYKVHERKSKCFLALKKHAEALVAFKETLQSLDYSKLPSDRKLKMQRDIQIMFQLLSQENVQKPTQDPQIKCGDHEKLMEKNPKYPSASNSIQILENDVLGRFAVATRNINVGETVLLEKSYCSVLVAEHATNHCLSCFKRTLALYPCKGCCMTVFCSESCQLNSDKFHRYECSFIGALYKCGISVLVLMAIRIITQKTVEYFQNIKHLLNKGPEVTDTYRSNDYLTVYHLVRHEDQRPPDNFLERTAIAVTLLRYLQDVGYFGAVNRVECTELNQDEIFIGGLLLRHLQILQFNAHEIAEFETDGTESLGEAQSKFIAGGLYPTLALFNHSCDPGIVRYNLGSDIVAKTVRTVKAGDQISENYGPIFTVNTKSERRQQLKAQYWFDCNCQPCIENWPKLTEMDKTIIPFRCQSEDCSGVLHVLHNTQDFMIKCNKCSSHTNILKGLKALQDTDSMFRKALNDMNHGNVDAALALYLEILTLLHAYLAPPFNDYHICQQAIRKCMLTMGNKYIKEN